MEWHLPLSVRLENSKMVEKLPTKMFGYGGYYGLFFLISNVR